MSRRNNKHEKFYIELCENDFLTPLDFNQAVLASLRIHMDSLVIFSIPSLNSR
jgi:hypothetical protein